MWRAAPFALVVVLGSAAQADALWDSRQPVTQGNDSFEVAVAPDRSFALVGPGRRSVVLTVRKVERVAASVTGCDASAERKVTMFVGGRDDEPINLNTVPGGKAVRVNLKC